ncbi:MAG: tyrosine-type recombinase/integrase [Gammaproteobacteria bacterium]
MACIRKRRGKRCLDYRDQHGRRHVESTKGTRKAAERRLAERVRAIGRGTYQAPSEAIDFGTLAESFLAHSKGRVRATTLKDYEGEFRRNLLPHFGGWRVRAIRRADVEAFRSRLIEENGTGTRTVNKCIGLLGSLCRYAIRHEWIEANPAEGAKLRASSRRSHDLLEANILTPPEISRLLEAIQGRDRVLFMAAILTGLRQGELLGLQWGDIDWLNRQIMVRRSYTAGRFYEPKTPSSRRKVDIPEGLVAALREWRLACPLGDHDLVFPNGAGKPESQSNVLKRGFYPALRRAGLRRIRFHDLRHTFASLLIHNGEHPKRIQALMGHSSINVTMDVYGHLMPEGGDQVADRLGALVFGESGYKTVTKLTERGREGS